MNFKIILFKSFISHINCFRKHNYSSLIMSSPIDHFGNVPTVPSTISDHEQIQITNQSNHSNQTTDINQEIIPKNDTLKEALIWIDCEMTGLNLKKDKIIEIAVIVTNWDLKELYTLGPLAVHVDEELLESMDDWNKKHHTKSGLIERVRQSNLSTKNVEDLIVDFLNNTCKIEYQTCFLSGNSVHADKEFIRKDMPQILNLLHYQLLDVSSFKLACRHFNPQLLSTMKKKIGKHQALDDIKESIEEFRFYKNHFIKNSSSQEYY